MATTQRAELAVGDVGVGVVTLVNGGGELDCGQLDRAHSSAMRWIVGMAVEDEVSAAVLEQLIVIEASSRSGVGRWAEHHVQLGHRSGEPGADIVKRKKRGFDI